MLVRRSILWMVWCLVGVSVLPEGVLAIPGERGGAPEIAAHKFHVTYGRMAVEDNLALLQIRLFKDDLEEALRVRFAAPDFTLAVTPQADSLFTRYFNEVFVLRQGALQIPGRITGSGEDELQGEAVWWYTVAFEAPEALQTFTVRHATLLDRFEDQKNIFKVKHFPSEKELSYYFTEGAEEYKIAF